MRTTNGTQVITKVTWDGPSGYYQLYEKSTPNGVRHPIGTPYNFLRSGTVTNSINQVPPQDYFDVSGTTSPYASAQMCAECHGDTYNSWNKTPHAQAFLNGQASNVYFTNHTVGYGLPTGFITNTLTPQLAGVQCENCHGPAANHVSNPSDSTAIPRVELAGTMCGGCHTAKYPPSSNTVSQTLLRVPDTSTDGLDVKASGSNILADAFVPAATAVATSVHIWGSWLNDAVPTNSPYFSVCFWSNQLNLPSSNLFSHTFAPTQYTFFLYTNGVREQFYDPVTGSTNGVDTNIWEYVFDLTTATPPFWLTNGTTYWLSVNATNASGINNTAFVFGWKSCPTNGSQDAVYASGLSPIWQQLRRPPALDDSLHLAFQITTAVTNQPLPAYEEWNASPHARVVSDVAADFTNNTSFISTCGRCHSGTVREAFLENTTVLPNAQEASAVGVACATCHDPHELSVFTNVLTGVIVNPLTGAPIDTNGAPAVYSTQLRNPFSSLKDYHTTGNWTTNYNPNVNVCGQCHNDRGALYTDTARAPHHSPQYNILIGTSGVINTNSPSTPHFNSGSHGLFITNQCVGCHMQKPAGTAGHSFEVTSFNMCAGCHGSAANAAGLITLTRFAITNRIDRLHAALDNWALTQAPAILGTSTYGTRAWEYTTPGDLSTGGSGPPANLQALIPANIKIARYNLYLALYDGSEGVHNPTYTRDLLDVGLRSLGITPKQ
jgi:hypothetical protein